MSHADVACRCRIFTSLIRMVGAFTKYHVYKHYIFKMQTSEEDLIIKFAKKTQRTN